MKFVEFVTAAALALCLPFAASAAPFAGGLYDAIDDDGEGRSIWTGPNKDLLALSHIVTGTGVTNTWTVGDSAAFLYDDVAGTAQLFGRATNTGTAGTDLQFDFVLDMVINPGGTPYGADAWPTADWAIFTLTSAAFTGVAGTFMDGLTYNVTQKGIHGPQAGIGANDKDGDLGFSMWYMWDRTDSATQTTNGAYTFNTGGYGDFNMDLVPDDGDVNPIPLPAGGVLMIGALGGLLALRRRKRV